VLFADFVSGESGVAAAAAVVGVAAVAVSERWDLRPAR
jgi:hypothetical protein